MLRYIVLVAEKWSDALHLQNALAAVHDGQFVLAHKLYATLSSVELKLLFYDGYNWSAVSSSIDTGLLDDVLGK